MTAETDMVERVAEAKIRDRGKSPKFEGVRIRSAALLWLLQHKSYLGDDCLKWPFARLPVGYGQLGCNGKHWGAHRKMCILAHGNPPSPEHHAAHFCGKGYDGCVNPKHLRWALPKENIADKAVHGTLAKGHSHYRARFTPEQVREIRSADLSKRGDLARLSERYGVRHSCIIKIRSGGSYA